MKYYPFTCIPGFIVTIMVVLIIAFHSCNPEEWKTPDCSECFVDEPTEAEINIKVSISNANPFVPVNIYLGRIEEEILVRSDTIRTRNWTTVLPVGQYYTVTATYRYRANWEWITAIDGNHVRTSRERTACDRPCWFVRGNNFNVELRY
jgi:hypothetical protein